MVNNKKIEVYALKFENGLYQRAGFENGMPMEMATFMLSKDYFEDIIKTFSYSRPEYKKAKIVKITLTEIEEII